MIKQMSSIIVFLLSLTAICRAQEEIEPYLKTTDFTFENAFDGVKDKENVFKKDKKILINLKSLLKLYNIRMFKTKKNKLIS